MRGSAASNPVEQLENKIPNKIGVLPISNTYLRQVFNPISDA
jgi:hypothetical protein